MRGRVLLLFVLLAGSLCYGQTLALPGSSGGGVTIATVATLPSGAVKGQIAVVTNGASASDCTTGGGTTLVQCAYSGSSWAVFSTSGVGYPSGSGIAIVSSGSSWGTTLAAVNGDVVYGSGGAWTASGSPSLTAITATTYNGGALSGTFSGAPTFSGSIAFTGTPTFSNTLALNTTGTAATFTGNLTGDATSSGMATTVVKLNGTLLSGLASGLLYNTTSTGVPSIATAAQVNTLIATLTGCSTATYVYTPQGADCVAPSGGGGGGSITGSGLTQYSVYYQASNALTLADAWGFPTSGSTVTISNASPGVITVTNALYAGALIQLATTGSLPTGLTAGTTYCVISSGLSTSQFEVATSCGGSAINTSSAGSGTQTVYSVLNSPAICVAATTTACNTAGNTVTDGSWTWTVGGVIYISTATPGALTQTPPSSSGYFVDAVGVAISATQILLQPDIRPSTIQ